MPFLSLPLEIHHRILSYLLSNGDVAALSLQCRTLHAMCDMATRRRYHRVSVSEAEDSLDNAFELLMDILKRPTLGQYVRHVECCQPLSKHKDYEETNFERYLSNEDMNLLREAVQMGGFTGSERDQVVNMLMQRMNRKSVFGGDYR